MSDLPLYALVVCAIVGATTIICVVLLFWLYLVLPKRKRRASYIDKQDLDVSYRTGQFHVPMQMRDYK